MKLFSDLASDAKIFDIAQRLCPVCRLEAEDEADEIGRQDVSGELVLRCPRCQTVFLGNRDGTILPNLEGVTLLQ